MFENFVYIVCRDTIACGLKLRKKKKKNIKIQQLKTNA